MNKATMEIQQQYDALFAQRKQEILAAKDELKIAGTTYYVSNDGNDEAEDLESGIRRLPEPRGRGAF